MDAAELVEVVDRPESVRAIPGRTGAPAAVMGE